MGEPRPADVLGVQIAEAWAELQAARADASHSPNCDSLRVEQYAELRMNRLLDRLHAGMSDKQRQAAKRRPVRTLTTA